MGFCINCKIATGRCNTIGSRLLQNATLLSIVREWVAPQMVTENDIICLSCYHAISQTADDKKPEEALLGHRRVCTLCGRSLLRRIRFHELSFGSVQDCRVIEVVKEWILPRSMSVSSFLCHSCWVRATKASRRLHSGSSTTASTMPIDETSSRGSCDTHKAPLFEEHQVPLIQEQPAKRQIFHTSSIVLPDYFRAVETESKCFVDGCHRSERNRVTLSMRKQLLKMHNYYVPPNNRLCDIHLTLTPWHLLNDITNNIINSFTANHIQDMLSLKDSEDNASATETKLRETKTEEVDINQKVEIRVEECEEKGTDKIYNCNSCFHSIVGFRYTCVECENYDLCLECEMNMTHPEHCMLRIPKPSPADKIQSILEAVGDKIRSLSEELKQSQIALDEIKVEVDFDEPTATDPLTNSPQSGTLTSDITAHTVHHIPSPIAAPSVARQREMSRSETVRGRADVTLQTQIVPATNPTVDLIENIDSTNTNEKPKRRKFSRQVEEFNRMIELFGGDLTENRLCDVDEESSWSHTRRNKKLKVREHSTAESPGLK